MEIKIKKLRDDAVLPVRKTDGAIGFDLAVPCDICIEHKRQIIPLGFALELPKGIEAKVEPRSGFSSKGIKGFELSVAQERNAMGISNQKSCFVVSTRPSISMPMYLSARLTRTIVASVG